MHGKLTAIVRYWLQYEHGGKKVLLSFGLGANVAVNYIVGIPRLKSWKCIFDFETHKLVAGGINTKFPLHYEATKHGLPNGIAFTLFDFEVACGRWAIGQNRKYLWGAHFWWLCDCKTIREIL